jgi:hypothetical protein
MLQSKYNPKGTALRLSGRLALKSFCDPRVESAENTRMKNFLLILALAILPAVGGQVLARHVTHPVTPKNIDKQPFSFSVQVKDVEELKEFEITVRQQAGKPAPGGSATGSIRFATSGNKPGALPAITRMEENGVQTYTFRLSPADLDRARFTFTETVEDWRQPFPSPGDYWVFKLSDFVDSPKK